MTEENVFHPTTGQKEQDRLFQKLSQLVGSVLNEDCVSVSESDAGGVKIFTVKSWAVGA